MAYKNAIVEARKIAKQYSYETVVKGIQSLALEGTLTVRDTEYGDEVYLTNSKGEIDLDDALRTASEHGAEVKISFTFSTPVDIAGSEQSDA